MINLHRVITRLERAGGELTECRALLVRDGVSTVALAAELNNINVRLGDLRRAAVRIESGEDPDAVVAEYRARWREEEE